MFLPRKNWRTAPKVRAIGVGATLLLGSGIPDSWADATATWPPEPLIEMTVRHAPTAFAGGGSTFLVYEIRVTNLSTAPVTLRRVEVTGAATNGKPIASYEGAELDAILQHFSNPAVGDKMPTAGSDYRQMAAGESAEIFLTIPLASGTSVPDSISHRLVTADAAVEGAAVTTHGDALRVIGAPVEGGIWHAYSGAAQNNSHHRRQFVVLGAHSALPSRYAIDWVMTEGGQSSSAARDDIRSYFSFGRPVIAVADATVVKVRNDIPDNPPGHTGAESLKLSRDNFVGNMVVLDLRGGQFAHYLHLQPGSVRVKVGDRVRRGQVLALIGSSGSSFEPHLHFEVTTSPETLRGEGLPYLIEAYDLVTKDGRVPRQRELPSAESDVGFPMATKR
jgi:peptidase M23-like protein